VGEKHHKPLEGKRVVVTRALEQSQSLVDALRHAGAEPVLLPLVALAPADNLAEIDACLKNSTRFDWVFFTSQNALHAVQQRCAALQLPLIQAFAGVKIAAVGPATAEAVTAAGLPVNFVSRIHTGVALAEELSAQEKRKSRLSTTQRSCESRTDRSIKSPWLASHSCRRLQNSFANLGFGGDTRIPFSGWC